MKRFQNLKPGDRTFVFYSENEHYCVHLQPLMDALVKTHGRTICYLTSSPTDPLLQQNHPRILAFYIGEGTVRTILFRVMEARLMIMTMPDLEIFYIKRSVNPVHYVYVHHSMVSTHMIYRRGAFDHFDTIFCVGPHHVKETRAWEVLHSLPPKNLVEHGYGRLDAILKEFKNRKPENASAERETRVLIAPSWGPHGLLETCGRELVRVLLGAGLHVTVRPHPQTRRSTPKILDAIQNEFAGNDRFAYEENISSKESLFKSDIMISDWSGAALEYAFGLERPVLFIDVPRKVNNPEYESIAHEPLEVFIREEIGAVLSPDELEQAPERVGALCADPLRYRDRIRSVRSKWVYNLETSGERGAEALVQLADAAANQKPASGPTE